MAAALTTRRALAPFLALGASLIVTAIAAQYAARAAATQERLRFDNAANRVRGAIQSRLDAYVVMLRGTAGLFAASEEVLFSEFRAYVARLHLPSHYRGIQGIGFSRLIAPAEREQFAATLRREIPSFHYWPDQPTGDIHAIVFLEPQDEMNRAAMGFDMWSEPVRQAAMARARDEGDAAATGRVRLVQEIDPAREQAGFLVYIPVYRGGRVPQTVVERRRLLLGFVYSPFRVGDLLRSAFDSGDPTDVSFDVYDGTVKPDALLFQSEAGQRNARVEGLRSVSIAGRTWIIVLRSAMDNATAGPTGRVVLLLVTAGGTALSVLLFLVMRTEVHARESAERIAEELRRSEEALRAANRQKDDFLAVISHELRTPLNAIVGWAAMLRRGQIGPDGQAHALQVIERNAAAQATLIEDLLDMSRAISGRLRLEKTSVDVAATLQASVDAVAPSANAGGVELVANVERDLGTIPADPARLQQIVLNLLSNAIKFTPPEGRVTLTAARRSAHVVIGVSDTGIGIEPEFLPHVFERFRQADTSTTRSHTGVGLGLAIARRLVELHGGSISVESEGKDRGSTFTVRLPTDRD